MNIRHIVDEKFLYPWSCSASYIESGRLPLDILIKRILSKILLPLYSDPSKSRRVQSSLNQYMRTNVDTYSTILLNKDWSIKPTVLIDEEDIRALTCRYHDGGEDKLALFYPQSPNGHILNAQQSDQLAHLVKIPLISSQKTMT